MISQHFTSNPTLPAGASSTLATALASADAWGTAPIYTSFIEALWSAAPPSITASLSSSGFYFDEVATADWFTKKAPKDVQKALNSYVSAVSSAESSVFSMVAAETSKGAAATGVPAVGVMGVAMAAGLGVVGMM